MRVTADMQFPADPASVFAMLSDQAFQERKVGAVSKGPWDVAVRQEGDSTVIVSHRTLPSDVIPESFRAMVSNPITITQTEKWAPAAPDSSRRGTVDVELSGVPVRLSGTLALIPTADGGCTEQIQGDLKAKIPLFGAKVERAAEPAVRAAIDAEGRIGLKWLAERS
ncbi:DUF2505 domain-containing protein [Kineosporia sp. J2-2]|uniref:DUF2505 domain-containing protein n=1 Tax=Kineosporia corallincola TaxID=2835133 RepID=A0ABS5TTJ3_9ACTN|nr:DUF2505 domain-containing protein [Kineosporia corallincola]MBT0774119.1 DUF2505 domain-containing protein [Kineosporia corallincola]